MSAAILARRGSSTTESADIKSEHRPNGGVNRGRDAAMKEQSEDAGLRVGTCSSNRKGHGARPQIYQSQTFKKFSFLPSPAASATYPPSPSSPNIPSPPPPFYSSLESASRVHSRPLKILGKEPPHTKFALRRSPAIRCKGRGCTPPREKKQSTALSVAA